MAVLVLGGIISCVVVVRPLIALGHLVDQPMGVGSGVWGLSGRLGDRGWYKMCICKCYSHDVWSAFKIDRNEATA